MDDIVKAALAKWPNVPEVYGWLKLDARGNWRVKSVRHVTSSSQAASVPFERIGNRYVNEFIHRNYECDDQGRWFFQNGPQRVFVSLELAPWVVQFDGQGALRLHTGTPAQVQAALLDDHGTPFVVTASGLASLDDRELMHWLECLEDAHGMGVSEALLGDFLGSPDACMLFLRVGKTPFALQRVARASLSHTYRFNPSPQPALGQPDCT
jgi:Protein of unknown function (DUF2946)